MSPKPVILDQDGGNDDLIALSLLLGNPQAVKLIGCVVTDADCFAENAFDASGKLMAMMHCTEGTSLFPIACTSFKGVNPFPSDWRWDAKNMDDLPCLNIPEYSSVWARLREKNKALVGEQLMADLVMNSPEKVTICVTGPLSSVAWCIERYGEKFTRNVERCVVMGGALDVKGNVFVKGKNGTAEWNIFWDPPAAKAVLENPPFETVLFALDATNHVPIHSLNVRPYAMTNEYLLSQFVGSVYSRCTHIEYMRPGDGYYAWDVLTAAYIIDPKLCALKRVDVEVIVDQSNPCEGRTKNKGTGNSMLRLPIDIKSERFFTLCYESVKRGIQKPRGVGKL